MKNETDVDEDLVDLILKVERRARDRAKTPEDWRENPAALQPIGTGPYKYVEDADEDGGHLVKFEDYWNKTAVEADGVFDIERIEVVNFPSTEAGGLAMNNALLSHALDGAIAGGGAVSGQIDIGAVESNKNINF